RIGLEHGPRPHGETGADLHATQLGGAPGERPVEQVGLAHAEAVVDPVARPDEGGSVFGRDRFGRRHATKMPRTPAACRGPTQPIAITFFITLAAVPLTRPRRPAERTGMARTSRAVVQTGPRRLEMRELPIPDIDDESGLLRIEACGICGSDAEQYAGTIPVQLPVV